MAANPDAAYDYYYNEQWQVLEERKNADTDPLSQYVWHPYYIDALAVRYWDYNTDGDYLDNYEGAQYFLHDANFNITAVMNASGTVLERYHYSPYGEITYLNANFAYQTPFLDNTHLYTGRERDPETGLQLNRHRFYHAQMGRWVNRDPVQYEGGTNFYSYVACRPSSIDPFGLFTVIPMEETCEGFLDRVDTIRPLGGGLSDIDERLNSSGTYIFCGDCSQFQNLAWKDSLGRCNICLSNKEIMDSARWEAILIHELTHCTDFGCKLRDKGRGKPEIGPPIPIPPPPPRKDNDCAICKKREAKAYNRQCEYLFPGDKKRIHQCVEAGKCYSCEYACANNPSFRRSCRNKSFPQYSPLPIIIPLPGPVGDPIIIIGRPGEFL